jgi:hypothetical protein
MASTHVEISGDASRFARNARSLVDSTRSVSNEASKMLAICNSYLGAAPNLALDATYADLAIALGFTGATANADAHAARGGTRASDGRTD